MDIYAEEMQIKENKNGEKIGDLVGECNFLESTVKALEV